MSLRPQLPLPNVQPHIEISDETSKSSSEGLSWGDKIFSVILLGGVIYGFLKILSEIIKHKDVPITVGNVAILTGGALTFIIIIFLFGKIREIPAVAELEPFGCLFLIPLTLLPFVFWQLALWLMGLFGFLPKSEVQVLLIHSFLGFSF